jgi:hypothetical protein
VKEAPGMVWHELEAVGRQLPRQLPPELEVWRRTWLSGLAGLTGAARWCRGSRGGV